MFTVVHFRWMQIVSDLLWKDRRECLCQISATNHTHRAPLAKISHVAQWLQVGLYQLVEFVVIHIYAGRLLVFAGTRMVIKWIESVSLNMVLSSATVLGRQYYSLFSVLVLVGTLQFQRLPLCLPYHTHSYPIGQGTSAWVLATSRYVHPKYTFGDGEMTTRWVCGPTALSVNWTWAGALFAIWPPKSLLMIYWWRAWWYFSFLRFCIECGSGPLHLIGCSRKEVCCLDEQHAPCCIPSGWGESSSFLKGSLRSALESSPWCPSPTTPTLFHLYHQSCMLPEAHTD